MQVGFLIASLVSIDKLHWEEEAESKTKLNMNKWFAWGIGKGVNNETVREFDELLKVLPPDSFNNRSLPVGNRSS